MFPLASIELHVYEQTVSLAGRSLRQLFVQDLGHEEPTILLTNQRHTPVKTLLTRYAQRMRGYANACAPDFPRPHRYACRCYR